MVFAAVLAFILLLGLTGQKPGARGYVIGALAALIASAWELLS